MGLLTVAQLQAMLHLAKKFISIIQLVKFAAGNVTFVMELLQREQGAAGPQPGLSASVDPLQALHEKFDVANSAAVQLHINGLAGRVKHWPGMTASMHAVASMKRGFNGLEIDLRGIDVRLHRTDKFARQARVAGRVTHLDKRLAFPIMSGVGVVAKGM